MTTSIVINTNKLTSDVVTLEQDEKQYNEDILQGEQRVGNSISINKSNSRKTSGIQSVFGSFRPLSQEEIEYSYINVDIESKISQGISVRSLRDTDGDRLPFIYIGYDLPYGNSVHERMYPKLSFSNFGTQELIKRDQFVVYEDDSFEYDADIYINASDDYRSNIYPISPGSSHRHYEDQFKTQGTIDPLDARRRFRGHPSQIVDHFSNTLTNRRFYSGITADIIGGVEKSTHGSNDMITDKIEHKEVLDHSELQDIKFNDINQKTRLDTSLIPIPFATANNTSTIPPFDDGIDYTKGKYSFYGDGLGDIIHGSEITGPYSNISEIGTRYKSSTTGFVYESTTLGNTTLGTDSIAFGGLARR